MAISTDLAFEQVKNLFLDSHNPRLGIDSLEKGLDQEALLKVMLKWNLEELAVSFLEGGGFWTHEAVLAVRERPYGDEVLVVVEGNRRIAALKWLYKSIQGHAPSRRWVEMSKGLQLADKLFQKVPYLLVGERREIESFLGFRHVTGIMEWKPAEKAEFIARLIDERKMSYQEVMRRIGSNTQTVRQTYTTYRLLKQMEDSVEGFERKNVANRFSVMYLTLRSEGVRNYLHLDIQADPKRAKALIPKTHVKALANFALWLFGDEQTGRPALFTDSRQADDFGRILESKEATKYLERNEDPKFEIAVQLAGGDIKEVVKHVEKAADYLELALTRAHLHVKSKTLLAATDRLTAGAMQLLKLFPQLVKKYKTQ
jgi:hypothetical protein